MLVDHNYIPVMPQIAKEPDNKLLTTETSEELESQTENGTPKQNWVISSLTKTNSLAGRKEALPEQNN
jgi:hypothetical protein